MRALLEDLDWLGLAPDPDPRAAPIVRQSERARRYSEALTRLAASEAVYACDCTRRACSRGPARGRGRGDGAALPGHLPRSRGGGRPGTSMRRVRLDREEVAFRDLRLGDQLQVPAEQCGDLLVRDRAGNWTYQFAVVVDDLAQGVDMVVRGEDLLASTGRQIQSAACWVATAGRASCTTD